MSEPTVQDIVAQMKSAVELSRSLGTPVADHRLILDWAFQLEKADAKTHARLVELGTQIDTILHEEG